VPAGENGAARHRGSILAAAPGLYRRMDAR
jgi:hypothetical protein